MKDSNKIKKVEKDSLDKKEAENKPEKKEEETEIIEHQERKRKKTSSKWWHNRRNKILLIISVSLLVVLIAAINVVFAVTGIRKIAANLFDSVTITLFHADEKEVTSDIPAIIPRRLDGVMVEREKANLVPACVMIENAAFGGVRPQSGLSQAPVVYEVIVEGGITRLMAVFVGDISETVGPVRSARDTYLEFASELNCAYYHAGGSFTAMQALYNFSLRDIDGLREYKFFYRAADKIAPHNFYTSTDKLYEAISEHGWDKEYPPTYQSWNFVDELSEQDSKRQPNVQVKIAFGGSYDVEYNYDEVRQVYLRKNGFSDHIDAMTGEVLTVTNVIIQHVGAGISIEGKGRINWPVTGDGVVEIYSNGTKIIGTWKKPTRLSRTLFYDASGDEIELLRGNSWVEIVPEHISIEST